VKPAPLPTVAEVAGALNDAPVVFDLSAIAGGVLGVVYGGTDPEPDEAADELIERIEAAGWFCRWTGYARDPIYVAVAVRP
jgi:hypothetical protein